MSLMLQTSTAADIGDGDSGNRYQSSLLEHRIIMARMAEAERYSFLQYRDNYLVYSHLFNGVNQQPIDSAFPDEEYHFRNDEVQFQISFMVPLAIDMFDTRLSLYGGYTNRSFWQVFDEQDSRPFRETNHEPEIWLSYFYDQNIGEINLPMLWFGYRHQSNGQYVSMSRGWNRLYVQAFFDYRRWTSTAIIWNRLPGGSPEDSRFDYEKYIGNGELMLDYAFDNSDLSLTYAYSFSGTEFGSMTLAYSYRLSHSIDFYLRYFVGYGESLIDLDYRSNTLSAGIKLSQW